jgi:hypothetical protein
MALVRERTIPTERQPLANDVNANFADRGGVVSIFEKLETEFMQRARHF